MKHSTILVTTSLTALALSISAIACSATQLLQGFISQHQLAKAQVFDTLEKNEFVYQGLKRSYYLYTPTSYNSNHQIPLVLVFHGSGGTGRTIAKYTGFNDVAEREGFLVVYPDGINYHWHDARNIFNINVNDVSFTAELINHLQQKRNIDRHRIYATGMSNGAIFTHTLACMLPNQFAAFSSVAGWIYANFTSIQLSV